jgi:hypothetical protein
MNINEKRISKIAGIIMLIFGLVIFFFDFKSGYKSFGIYLIPLIFVIVALLVIFKDNISNWFDKQIVIKEFIAKNNKFIFFILPFSIFSIIDFQFCFLQ